MSKDFLIGITFGAIGIAGMAIRIFSSYRLLTQESYQRKLMKNLMDLKDDRDGTEFYDEYTRSELNAVNTKEAGVGPDTAMNMTSEKGVGANLNIVKTKDSRTGDDKPIALTREKGVGPDTQMIVTKEKAVGPNRNIVETVDKRTGSNSPTFKTREIGVGTDTMIILANESWAEAVEIEQANGVIEETPCLRTPTDVRPNPNQPKPMKEFPEEPYKYHPVLLLNQLHPRIKYDDIIVNIQPFVFRVFFDLLGEQFEGYGPSKKAARKEACISAINYFYNFNCHLI